MLILSFGCGKKTLTEERLVGSYHVKFPHGSENLLLKEDRTFVQIYASIGNGQPQTNTGTWDYDLKFNDVFLTGAVLHDKGNGQINTNLEKTVWSLLVTQTSDKISLCVDADRVYLFEKQ